jgi:vitamin K-dependent gamma-carboxylase-like protein
MNDFVQRWDRFWFAEIPTHIYALLRIAFGLVGCITLWGLRDVSMFWFLDGLVPLDVGIVGLKQFFIAHGLAHAAGAALYGMTWLAYIAMILGFQTRIAVPAALFTALMQVAWNYLPLSGADAALRLFLFCLVWAECGAVWSVDAWMARRQSETGSSSSETGLIAPLRLIRFQIALIYLNAGFWKLFNPLWRSGVAVHYVVLSNIFRRLPHGMPVQFDTFVTVLTYGTLAWELSFAFLLLFQPTRRIALITGILMHLGMLVTLEVGPFHLIMLASYLAFLDPESVAALPRRCTSIVRRPRVAGARLATS